MIQKGSWIKKVALTGMFACLGGGIAYWYVQTTQCTMIQDFNEARDLPEILKAFERDRYWLTANPDSRPDILFKERTPNVYKPHLYGTLNIKVLWEQDKFVGFVTYYKKNFYEGKILFIDVNPGFRGKRYGQKLLEYAFDDFKSQGIKVVGLVTRPSNHRAIKLYKRIGFVQTKIDDTYVWFKKNL